MNSSHSTLFDSNTFYAAFHKDLRKATQYVVIESPFITLRRYKTLAPELQRLVQRGVRVVINTKPLDELDLPMKLQSGVAIPELQAMGVVVLMTVGHHRKLAVIDDIVWEGSLNILSQYDSCEIMRRAYSAEDAMTLLKFTGLMKWL